MKVAQWGIYWKEGAGEKLNKTSLRGERGVSPPKIPGKHQRPKVTLSDCSSLAMLPPSSFPKLGHSSSTGYLRQLTISSSTSSKCKGRDLNPGQRQCWPGADQEVQRGTGQGVSRKQRRGSGVAEPPGRKSEKQLSDL